MLTCKCETTLDSTIEDIRRKYKETVAHKGKKLSYIGMTFDFEKYGECWVSMEHFISELMKSSGIQGTAKTPARDTLFEIRADSKHVDESDRKWFHTNTAKLLYLAKRVRPECLTAVSFLTTRVDKVDVDDMSKLKRTLQYINGTQSRGIVLKPGEGIISVRQYIDAAYGVHQDMKSHTGSATMIGEGACVHVKSAKQKIVTKSSTEAELVGLSDSANNGLHLRNFLKEQGYNMEELIIFQDNLSCMAMMKKGRNTSERSRHIDIRRYWLHERVENKEVKFAHVPTEEMFANIVTKPLQGKQFLIERKGLTGWPDQELIQV
jgi:hypothetical protein